MQCQICEEAITNPICVECLGEEMQQWLMEEKPSKVKEVKAIIDFYKYMTPISKCIKCNKEMTVCRHCFTKEIFEIIKGTRLEEDFLRQFNYELVW